LDTAHHSAIDGSGRSPDAARIISNVEELGEPWTFGFVPEELPFISSSEESNWIGMTAQRNMDAHTLARLQNP